MTEKKYFYDCKINKQLFTISDNHSRKAHSNTFSKKNAWASHLQNWDEFWLDDFSSLGLLDDLFLLLNLNWNIFLSKNYIIGKSDFFRILFFRLSGTKKKEVLFSPKINFERRRSRFALLYVYLLSMFSPPTRLRLIKIASRAENWISRRLLILAWSDFWSIFDHDTRKNAEIIAVRSQYDIYIVTQIAKSRI